PGRGTAAGETARSRSRAGRWRQAADRVFGLDLHWLPHAHGALGIAALVKKLHPDAKVLVGGLSATYFHAEVIRNPAVDFVLRGDSTEEPARQLLAALRTGAPLETVENLTWKAPRRHRGGEPA
ncbi:MAG: hypothetical protein ACRDOH_24650, partial [Streptosporangiaceae bacterium]